MNLVKRALVPMLIAALVVPAAASAQEPGRPVNGARAPEPESPRGVRLTFEGGHHANPWAVFGGGGTAVGDPQPGVRIGDAPANGSRAWRTRLVDIEATALAKSQPAAKRGMAGQSQSWNDWWCNRPGLLLIAIVAGVIVLVATGHADEIPWLSGR